MPDSSQRRGFSFQLSDSPPPVRAEPPAVPRGEPRPSAEEPAIRRVAFPAQRAAEQPLPAPAAPLHADSEGGTPRRDAQRPAPPTRFSTSVGTRPLGLSTTEMHEAASDDELALPEDLPGPAQSDAPSGRSSAAPRAVPPPVSDAAPSAAELWRRARDALAATRTRAVGASARGLAGGQRLASGVSGALRERLEALAAGSAPRAPRGAPAPAPSERAPQAMAAPVAPLPSGASAQPLPTPNARTRLATARRLAAPAAALAAAGAMYVLGTTVLARVAGPELAAASSAPHVPDLGETPGAAKGAPSEPGLRRVGERRARPGDKAAGPSSPDDDSAEGSGPPPVATTVVPMPPGLSWPGKGLIEVVTSGDELVYVDGVFVGRGPLRRVPVIPGEHEVSIRTEGERRDGVVEVLVDRSTRAVFASE